MSERDDTFLIAVTVTGSATRAAARHEAYTSMTRLIGFGIDSWWDASTDSDDRNDNGEAVWTHPGRGFEGQRALVLAGLAAETDERVGEHERMEVVRNDRGEVMVFECPRCDNGSDHPATLAEVPCEDVAKWEHGHLWVSDDDEHHRITCLSDCGMTVQGGRFHGEVDADKVGAPPESEHDHGYYPEN